MLLRSLLIMLALLAGLLPLHGHADPMYTVSVLPEGFIPADINNAGQIAGSIDGNAAVPYRAAIDANGVVTQLDPQPESWSQALAINDAGAIVGQSDIDQEVGHSPIHPLLYRDDVLQDLYEQGAMTDLGNFGDIYLDVNDLAQIVGFGCKASTCSGIRLDPASAVPEPRGTWLWLAGLIALARALPRRITALPRFFYRRFAADADAGTTRRTAVRVIRDAHPFSEVTMFFRLSCLALAMVPALAMPVVAHAEALYTVNFLPENFYPVDINNAGQIAGIADFGDNRTHAAMYASGVVTDLVSTADAYLDVVAITEAGTVLGNVSSQSGENQAFVYSNGTTRQIPGLYAYDINARGDVVGYDSGAVLYSQGTFTALGHLGTGDFSNARAINDAGDIVGTSTIDLDLHSRQHPFLYRDGVLHDLGTLDEREFNSAVAINSAGQIAGYSEGAGGGMHAFIYENGVMTDLGSFGGLNLDVNAMNGLGQIVGSGNTWDGPDVAFISREGALVDLNTLIDPASGWQIIDPRSINDLGQVIGTACNNDLCRPVRLDLAGAVPEPGGVLLLLSGVLMLAGARRARRKKAAGPCGCGGFSNRQRWYYASRPARLRSFSFR